MSESGRDGHALVGDQLGNYIVKRHIARRHASNLYLALDAEQDQPMFLEMLSVTGDERPDLTNQFWRRIEEVTRLSHPNIARVTGSGVTSTRQAYALIEHVEGMTLAERLANQTEGETWLTPVEALTLVRQIADALAAAHSVGMIHHDLRPENIYITLDQVPVLVDLEMPPEVLPASESVRRTAKVDYAPPEQLQGKKLNRQGNIYSLGVILYELLAGQRPEIPTSDWDIFERGQTRLPRGIPLESARKGLSSKTYHLVRNCMYYEEWNRFEDVEQMIVAIDEAIVSERARAEAKASLLPTRSRLIIAIPLFLIAILAMFLIFRDEGANASSTDGRPPATLPSGETISAAGLAVAETPSETPVQTKTPTPALAETIPVIYSIDLLSPAPDAEFTRGDEIFFDWFWPLPLESGQQFVVILIRDDERIRLGTIANPIISSQYRLLVEDGDTASLDGTYEWQVLLESTTSNGDVVESQKQTISFVAPPTPTLVPQPTLTPTSPASTDEPGATPVPTTSTVCEPQPPEGWVEYSVQAGDALFTLAIRGGASVEQVQAVNCLTSDLLSVGMSLWLPSIPATNTPEASPTSESGGSGGGSGNRRPGRSTPTPPKP